MLLVAALLSFIIWVLGWSSGFLGPTVHIFLLLAILAVLANAARALSLGAGVQQSGGAANPEEQPEAECADGAAEVVASAEDGSEEGRQPDERGAESIRSGAPE